MALLRKPHPRGVRRSTTSVAARLSLHSHFYFHFSAQQQPIKPLSVSITILTMSESKPKCVLAYSGGLDTSVILTWLCEKGFDVIAFCADVGQHHEDFEAVKAKAVTCGAIKCVVTDLRKGA